MQRTHLGMGVGRWLLGASLLGALLPGCPLSDDYFVDPQAGLPVSGSGGATARGGAAGAPLLGGSPAVGGNASGGAGATTDAGSGGVMTSGGTGASGGTSGTDSSGGAPDAGTTGDAGGDALGGAGGETSCDSATERCDGIDNDCDGMIDEGSVCPDSCVAKQNDGQLYLLCVSTDPDDAIGADDAFTRCVNLGAELDLEEPLGLAWIDSSDENTFLKTWIRENVAEDGAIWIGANDQVEENAWVWGRRSGAEQFFAGDDEGGGTPYMGRFNDWAFGEPDGGDSADCGALDATFDWEWSDWGCDSAQMGFVCDEHPRF